MKKIIKTAIAAVFVCMFWGVISATNVVAEGYAGAGNIASGGGACYAWGVPGWDSCFGYSWQAYEVKNNLPAPSSRIKVHFEYSDGTDPKGPVNLYGCKKGQILYNHGFEVYDKDYNGNYVPTGYQISTQAPKGKEAKRYVGGGLGSFSRYYSSDGDRNTTTNYLLPRGYANVADVEKKYNQMVDYDNKKGTHYTSGTSWDNVGYFCFDPDAEEVTLTVDAYSSERGEDGEYIKLKENIDSDTVNPGETASVTSGNYNPTGYVWWKWGDKGLCASFGSDRDCIVDNLTESKRVNAYYKREVTLRAYAKDENGNLLQNSPISTATVPSGDNVTVNSNQDFDGYIWTGWEVGCDLENGRECTKNNMTSNQDVYAIYTRNEFRGKVDVSGTIDESVVMEDSTGYVDNGLASIRLEGCPRGGCNVRIEFSLRPEVGDSKTSYEVYRVSGGSFPDYTLGAMVKAGEWNTGDSNTVYVHDKNVQLGKQVCYVMKYNIHGIGDEIGQVAGCAKVESLEIEGKIKVSGDASGEVGWTDVDVTRNFEISDCSGDGCEVSFDHMLRLVNSVGRTAYEITRTSNWPMLSGGVVNSGQILLNRTNGDGANVASDTVRIYPGVKICETLKFLPNGTGASLSGVNVIINMDFTTVKTCVLAGGDSTIVDPDPDPNPDPDPDPTDPSLDPGNSNAAYLNMLVKNMSTENRYRKMVWAKPYDNVEFKSVYNPKLQYTYSLVVDGMRINNSDGDVIRNNIGMTLQSLFNNNSNMANWNNAYTVSWGNTIQENIFEVGDDDRKTSFNGYGRSVPNGGAIWGSDVGRILEERAEINKDGYNSVQTTPSKIEFSIENGKIIANIQTGSLDSVARVKVPYNFENSTAVTDNNEVVYAGESKMVSYDLYVGKKENELTNGEYATPVPNARWGLMVKYGDGEWSDYMEMGSGSLNYENYNRDGASIKKRSEISIPDVVAGTQVCVKSWMWPATSGADDSMSVDTFSGIAVSQDEVCFTVAKKPSFQVWGGDLVIDGDANAAVSKKTKLSETKLPGYDDGAYIFGSWAELGLIANGTVSGIASGASMGYASNIGNGTLWPAVTPADGLGNNADIDGRSPGGSVGNNFCIRSVLSFANERCSGGAIGFNENNFTSSDSNVRIISGLVQDEVKDISDLGNDTLGNQDGGISYYTQSGNISIFGTRVLKNNTIVVYARNASINIFGNIEYEESEYEKMEEVPKMILYAEKNISINCNVTRVDAILIAGGTIYTCNDDYDDSGIIADDRDANLRIRSTQLRINGAISANKLVLGRTYGAATGANSMVPAEIINYDSSVYLWANKQKDVTTTNSSKLVESYVHELSPRY